MNALTKIIFPTLGNDKNNQNITLYFLIIFIFWKGLEGVRVTEYFLNAKGQGDEGKENQTLLSLSPCPFVPLR